MHHLSGIGAAKIGDKRACGIDPQTPVHGWLERRRLCRRGDDMPDLAAERMIGLCAAVGRRLIPVADRMAKPLSRVGVAAIIARRPSLCTGIPSPSRWASLTAGDACNCRTSLRMAASVDSRFASLTSQAACAASCAAV